MELDKLKSNWRNTGRAEKNKDELLKMTKIENHPKVQRIRVKFLIESILLVVFIAVYYDGFDGDNKPMWANLLLISATLTYILVRFSGWLILRNPIKDNNLKKSLLRFQKNLKQIAIWVLISSFAFGLSIISFFMSSIEFTSKKYGFLSLVLISLVVLIYISNRNWIKRIRTIKATLKDFDIAIE